MSSSCRCGANPRLRAAPLEVPRSLRAARAPSELRPFEAHTWCEHLAVQELRVGASGALMSPCGEVMKPMVWKSILESNIHDLKELEARGLLTSEETGRLQSVTERHPMSVTPYYLSLID